MEVNVNLEKILREKNLPSLPSRVSTVIDDLIKKIIEKLAENIGGIYIHGSICFGCFNANTSDVDLIILVKKTIEEKVRREIMLEILVPFSDKLNTKGLEVSFVNEADAKEFCYPTPFDLHYSNDWREKALQGELDYKTSLKDPDLAAHFMVIKKRGICIYGKDIESAFGEVERSFYLQSIVADAEDIMEEMHDAVYGILNLARVLAFIRDEKVLSKKEGGEWGMSFLPERFHTILALALNEYEHATEYPYKVEFDKQLVNDYVHFMKESVSGHENSNKNI